MVVGVDEDSIDIDIEVNDGRNCYALCRGERLEQRTAWYDSGHGWLCRMSMSMSIKGASAMLDAQARVGAERFLVRSVQG